MFSLRLSVVALLAISLIARFDQGAALKCYVCTSASNEDCSEDPERTDLVECSFFDVTTASPATSTALPATSTAPPATSTAPPATSTAPPATSTAPPATTAATTPPAAPAGDKSDAQKSVEAVNAPRDVVTMACTKTITSNDGVSIVARACMIKGNCATLNGTNGVECYECDDKDGCNGSSRISLGIMSILIPVGLIAILFR